MKSGTLDEYERRSLGVLQEMSSLLEVLADELEDALRKGASLDTSSLTRLAAELQANHNTLVSLSKQATAPEFPRPNLN